MPWKRKDGEWPGQVRQGLQRVQERFLAQNLARAWESDQKRRPSEQRITGAPFFLRRREVEPAEERDRKAGWVFWTAAQTLW